MNACVWGSGGLRVVRGLETKWKHSSNGPLGNLRVGVEEQHDVPLALCCPCLRVWVREDESVCIGKKQKVEL